MNQLINRILGVISNDIQVSGLPSQEYSEDRWREAILFYLFGIWSGKESVTYRPKITFGDITLRLDPQNSEYYAYGQAEVPALIPMIGRHESLVERSGKQTEVEVALIRFVKDGRIKLLCLRVPSVHPDACLVLWKKKKRGEYGYEGIGLPYTWGTKGPIWTKEDFERAL